MARPLGKLFASSDILSGEEAKTLREYCATAYMESEKDLKDPYGISIETGNFAGFRERFRSRIQHFEGRQYEAAQELFRLRWGPTRSPVYVVLLAFSIDRPRLRYEYITLALWLIQTVKVPVDQCDISGTTALMHALSTKPYMDEEFAQIMLDAGANINRRDRFGAVVGLDIATIHLIYDDEAHDMAGRALLWFLEHGGDVDIKDGEDVSTRDVVAKLEGTSRTLSKVLEEFEQRKVKGKIPNSDAIPRPTARNGPCPCGSSRKFKKCCGNE